MKDKMQRILDIGLPDWPAVFAGKAGIVVTGKAATMASYRLSWRLCQAICLVTCPSIAWIVFSHAFRTVDRYGNYTVPPESSDIWIAAIVSLVAFILIPRLVYRIVVHGMAQFFAPLHEVGFNRISTTFGETGTAAIPRETAPDEPVEIRFWAAPHEEHQRRAQTEKTLFLRQTYAESRQVFATVQTRIGRKVVPVAEIIGTEAANSFAAVCNAANAIAAELFSDEEVDVSIRDDLG